MNNMRHDHQTIQSRQPPSYGYQKDQLEEDRWLTSTVKSMFSGLQTTPMDRLKCHNPAHSGYPHTSETDTTRLLQGQNPRAAIAVATSHLSPVSGPDCPAR